MPTQIASLAKAMKEADLMTKVGSRIVVAVIERAAGKIIGPIGKDWDDKWPDSKPGWGDTWENHWTGECAIAIRPDELAGLPAKDLVVEVVAPSKLSAVHVKNLAKYFSKEEIVVLKQVGLIKSSS